MPINDRAVLEAKLQIARECLVDAVIAFDLKTNPPTGGNTVARFVEDVLAGGMDNSYEIDACLRAMQRAWGTAIVMDGNGKVEAINCYAYGWGDVEQPRGVWSRAAAWVKEKLS